MQKYMRIAIGGLVAALTLAAAVGTANARRLGTSERFFLSHFASLTFEGVSSAVICPVSLEGSFHSRTIEKIVRGLIGYISEARINRAACTGGKAWIQSLQERGSQESESLPWHILYERFIGPLPNITGIEITVDNALFLVEINAARCVYRASTTSPLRGILNREAGGKLTGLRMNETSAVPKIEGSPFCANTNTLKGTGRFGTDFEYSEITITLVA
jgi:hypothetical protein